MTSLHVPLTDLDKITILLADEDALRRDGLAAVLQGVAQFEVVAQCPDGQNALEKIRDMHPDVAVVDLNIPKLHGIELIRRIRSESLGTRVVILSGSTDDAIIREVVRAGGDAYLLKSGPARHLVDAISYVRDGGQYFSPQLRRDGLDRHLLEEPTRALPEGDPQSIVQDSAPGLGGAEDSSSGRTQRDRDRGYGGSPKRAPAPRSAEPRRLRDRMREDGDSENLAERDYEILEMMADGIRPLLDRLEEIEGRVNGMETGEEPVPSDPRGWLSTQMTDTFRDPRSGRQDMVPGRTVQDLEARLPRLIEQAVTSRFHQMADKLQAEIEDTHVRTLETFVKNIQVKLVQRVSALETDMTKQAEAMNQLRDYSQRTEDNLSRLITGVDRLAQELPKRIAAAGALVDEEAVPDSARVKHRRSSRSLSPKIFWAVVAVILIMVATGVMITRGSRSGAATAMPDMKSVPSASAEPLAKPPEFSASADTKTKLQAAQDYADRKDYATAEDIFKQVLKTEPGNADALKALASVLYREDKIEESAAILDKLK